ncbi:D-alanyl-D-alanine carboxypeptidase [Mycobacterium florentinum]|uniref:D-alanyl-D-alanine carboxypeptidase n=1 Tax=Mycobacterium florentinum TaxID=292462 RepID=A0A1X1TU88_MYCFL|nr:D-alanyl-D-alanine carboxypeptidase family protein [Mycobacterium florentinum]MCV7409068.1 D-alanyl-D-alanine carboxypeptidase [Mycobacterium florentinum]ORV48144.1 D-alanyl-D-alanine carboxypeptidase [Mycobacterium florentinum]
MRKLIAAAAALLTVAGVAAPQSRADDMQPIGSVPIPDGPAQTWILADMDSGQVLAGRDQFAAHPPASTIKVLLALVALDEVSMDSTVVADVADTQVECNCVGIKPGRTYTARQLLDGLLLVSGNDAANTLAHLMGGADATVAKMNAKAASLGATSTHAATPSGLDGPGGSGASTAHDLAVIFRAAMANPMFAHITAEPSAMFPGDHGDEPITNQDELLTRYPGAIGGKTGFTNAARKTFVGAASRGGRRLVVAMMYGMVKPGGPTYWDQAGSLFDWGFALNPSSSIGSL